MSRLLHDALTTDTAGGGRDEALFRMLVGAWRARHAGLLDLTAAQSRAFFTWVGAFFDVEVPAADSVLVGSWRPFDQQDESILRATVEQVEQRGLAGLRLEHVAAAAGVGVGDLVSTFGDLDRLLEDQRAYLAEQIHDADIPLPFAGDHTVAVDELWRLFDHAAAEAALADLTLGGLTPADARALVRDADLYDAVLGAPALDPVLLGSLLLLDAHRTVPAADAPARACAVPHDLAQPFLDALATTDEGAA